MDLVFVEPLEGQVTGFLFQTRPLYIKAAKEAGGFTDTQKLCYLLRCNEAQAASIARNFLAGAAQIAENRQAVGGLGLIPELLKLVDDPNPGIQLPGIAALATVVSDAPMNQERLCGEKGAIEKLSAFLESSDAIAKEQALRIVSHVARNAQVQHTISEASLRLVLKCIPWAKTKECGRDVQSALSVIANMAGSEERQALLLQIGACDVFVDYLSSPVVQLREFALAGLVRGTQMNDAWRLKVAEGDGIRYTIAQLQTTNARVVRQACLIIRNLTLDQESESGQKSYAAVVRQAGNLLPLLMALLPAGSGGGGTAKNKLSGDSGVSATALAVLSGLASHESVRETFQSLGGISHFMGQIEALSKSPNGQEDTITSLLFSLAQMLDDDNNLDSFLEEGGAGRLLAVLSASRSTGVQTEVLRILANVAIFEDSVRDSVVASDGARSAIMKSLLLPDLESRRQALRLLTNVALTPAHVPQLLKLPSGAPSNLPKACVDLVNGPQQTREGGGMSLGDHALLLLINLTSHDAVHGEAVKAAKGGLEWFVALLRAKEEGTQLRGLKMLTNLSRRGQYRKWLNESPLGVVDLATAMSKTSDDGEVAHEIKNQATTLLANLSFPYEDFYPDEEQLKTMPLPEIVEISKEEEEGQREVAEESEEARKKRDEEKKRLREQEEASAAELAKIKAEQERLRKEEEEEEKRREEELRREEEEQRAAEAAEKRAKEERQRELAKVEAEKKALAARLEEEKAKAVEEKAREEREKGAAEGRKRKEREEREARVEALRKEREEKRKREEEARERERKEQEKLEALMAERRAREKRATEERATKERETAETATETEAAAAADDEKRESLVERVKALTTEVESMTADVEKRKERVKRYKGRVEKAKKKEKKEATKGKSESKSKSERKGKSKREQEKEESTSGSALAEAEADLKSAKRRLARSEKALGEKKRELETTEGELCRMEGERKGRGGERKGEKKEREEKEDKGGKDEEGERALAEAKERVAKAKKERETKERERKEAERAHEKEQTESKGEADTEGERVREKEREETERRAKELKEKAESLEAKQREIEEAEKKEREEREKRERTQREKRERRLAAIQLSKKRFQEQLLEQRARELEKEKELEKARAEAEKAERERERVSASVTSPLSEEEQRERLQKKRTNIAREILDTEKSYVEGLQVLVDRFEAPMLASLQTKAPLTTAANARLLFSCVGIILNFNKILLESLDSRLRQWSSEQVIGDVFLKMTDFLKCYVQYVNNYNDAMRVASECRKDKRTSAFLRRAEAAKECRHLSFESFLIMPVQRVPRYVMLLADLLKNTWDGHPDKAHLAASLEKMQQTGNTINEKKRESEAIARLYEVFATMHGKHMPNLIEPSRRFVKEGPIQAAKKESLSGAYLHLFNDLLVVSKPKKGQGYEYKGRLELTVLTVAGLEDTKKVKNAFKLSGVESLEKRGTKVEYTFSCETEKERDGWVAAICEQQTDVTDKRKSFRRASRIHKK